MERFARLQDRIDLDSVGLDYSPAQLVEAATLHDIHTMFTLLGVHLAYVTRTGKLVGVIGVQELRRGIDVANEYALLASHEPEAESRYERSSRVHESLV